MDKIKLAYIAGLLDGDGCITLTRRRGKQRYGFQAQIILCMTDKETIEWVYKYLGFGYLTERKRLTGGGYRIFTYGVSSIKNTRQLLELVQPYLKSKKQVAGLLYKWVTEHKTAPRGRGYGDYQIPAWEFNVFDQIHLLTQKRSSLRI